MSIQMTRKKHRKPMMDQRRMWRTQDIVVESVKFEHGNDADADEEKEASQPDEGSTQNGEDRVPSTGECGDWTLYFRPGE